MERVRSVHVPKSRAEPDYSPRRPVPSPIRLVGTAEMPVPTPVSTFLMGQQPVPGQKMPVILSDARWSAFSRRGPGAFFPDVPIPAVQPFSRGPATRGSYSALVLNTDF